MSKETQTPPSLKIQPFTEEPIRFIDDEGRPVGEGDPAAVLGLEDSHLLFLYEAMVRTREIDRMGWILVRQGKAAFYISIGGQEAAHIGSLYALDPEDWVMPYYRTEPSLHLRGATLEEIFGQILGTNTDPSKGRQMPGHFGSKKARAFVIGSTVALGHVTAMGVAMALKYRKERQVVISYGGEGSTSEGHFHSALNFAGVFQLPLIVFIQNNHYAISVPRPRQTAAKTLAIKAKAYGLPGYYVDGNDVLAVYAVTQTVVDQARAGGGPALIEALTYRLDPHSSADDDKRYRSTEEVEAWRRKDPLIRFRKYLESKGLWDETKEQELRERIQKEIENAVEIAENAGLPDPREMFLEVYADAPPHLLEEMQELLQEIQESRQGGK